MAILAIITLVVVFVLWPILETLFQHVGTAQDNDTTIIADDTQYDDEVTVEDMVLHDMNNNDDTYDIGVIDFNE